MTDYQQKMDQQERRILESLDLALRNSSLTPKIDEIVERVSRKFLSKPAEVLAWESVPLDFYTTPLPEFIRSSWVFILRANTVTGAERHPNSHQRMMSYRGSGDFQTCPAEEWISHHLVSDPKANLTDRWISIPPSVWHQGIVPAEDWVVVSFHTVEEQELIEERPATDSVRQRRYSDEAW